jgi:hypothetical protein
MSCECYKVGGPWITCDPDCPTHGLEAQRRDEEREEKDMELKETIELLTERVKSLENQMYNIQIQTARF